MDTIGGKTKQVSPSRRRGASSFGCGFAGDTRKAISRLQGAGFRISTPVVRPKWERDRSALEAAIPKWQAVPDRTTALRRQRLLRLISDIFDLVVADYDVSRELLFEKDLRVENVEVRSMAAVLFREDLGMKYPKISLAFKRDTARWSSRLVANFKQRMLRDVILRERYEKLRDKVDTLLVTALEREEAA